MKTPNLFALAIAAFAILSLSSCLEQKSDNSTAESQTVSLKVDGMN